VSAWQHCEPMKGCLKLAFMPNGHVIEQYSLAGSVVTAYGRYHIRGAVLKIGWKRFEPTEICTADIDANGGPDSCLSTAQFTPLYDLLSTTLRSASLIRSCQPGPSS
jgi:hypothetical protein